MRFLPKRARPDPPRSPAPTDGSRRDDLSSRIEPFVYPSNSSTPTPSLQSQVRSLPSQDTRTDAVLSAPARRQSLRARSSSEDPWVMVNDPPANMESRTSSIASLMPSGAAAPYNSPQFTQPTTIVPTANAVNPASLPSSPIQQQRSPPMSNRRPNPPPANTLSSQQQPSYSSVSVNGHTPQVYSDPNSRLQMESQENVREGSIHSQPDKSWTGNLFGRTGAKEKEANAELMRMIGFLTAAAPDDWNLVLEVCERASANESAAKEASRALRREFKYGEPSAQLSAARLWAIMLQNATDTFILQTASRKFLDSLEEVILSETTSPVVRERLLDVLASAAYVYGKKPGKEGFASLWKKVRPSWKPAEGVPFDPEDLMFDSAFPRRAAPPGQAVLPPIPLQQQQQQPPHSERDKRDERGSKRDRGDRYYQQQRQLEVQQQHQTYRSNPTPAVPSRRERGIIPPEEDMRKLFEECDIARNNAQILNQALMFASPATLHSTAVIQEFHAKCRASQELIVAQIPWASAGAERSRMSRNVSKESGSDSNTGNKLTRRPRDNNAAGGGEPDLTREERLLASLLDANQQLIEVFRIYDELEKIALAEKEEREIAKRSIQETRIDRTQIHLIQPDGSKLEPPHAAAASSSSRSGSPMPTSARSMASPPIPANSGKRDLPLPPPQTIGSELKGPNNLPPSAYQQPPSPMQPQTPSQAHTPIHTQPHHAHHGSTPSLGGHNNLNVPPPAAPLGPRSAPSTNRSRTPSPDRPGLAGNTPPATVVNSVDYGPPPGPPPHMASRAVGGRVDSLRRTESPAPGSAPPGLVAGSGAMHNVAGMRVDTDAARTYENSDEDDLLTPIRPSAKALGKRRAEVEEQPDEEELEAREEAELEEAFLRSTAPPDVEMDVPKPVVHYIYDAAAERAKELDRMEREEREKERLRREQTRSSVQRVTGAGGGSGTAQQPVAAAAVAAAASPAPAVVGAVNSKTAS